MTLKLKVGRKGYIIIPKTIREAAGIEEGDEVIATLNDGIVLKPVRRMESSSLKAAIKRQKKSIFSIKGALTPPPGEASKYSLEDEFD